MAQGPPSPSASPASGAPADASPASGSELPGHRTAPGPLGAGCWKCLSQRHVLHMLQWGVRSNTLLCRSGSRWLQSLHGCHYATLLLHAAPRTSQKPCAVEGISARSTVGPVRMYMHGNSTPSLQRACSCRWRDFQGRHSCRAMCWNSSTSLKPSLSFRCFNMSFCFWNFRRIQFLCIAHFKFSSCNQLPAADQLQDLHTACSRTSFLACSRTSTASSTDSCFTTARTAFLAASRPWWSIIPVGRAMPPMTASHDAMLAARGRRGPPKRL